MSASDLQLRIIPTISLECHVGTLSSLPLLSENKTVYSVVAMVLTHELQESEWIPDLTRIDHYRQESWMIPE
jgi:hypothetical protein